MRRFVGQAAPGDPTTPAAGCAAMPQLFAVRIPTAPAARVRLAFVLALAVLVVGMSVKYAAKASKPGESGQQTRSAFLRWRAMIHEVFAGGNVYVGAHEYPNPPVMAVILKPFADLPPLAGALTWFYAKVLMAALAFVWVFRLLRRDGAVGREEGDSGSEARGGFSPSPLPFVLTVLLSLPPILGDLSHNNVNIFILFLVAACLELYRCGRDTGAGLVLGLAIACKVTPLLFVAYFGWKRAWRVLAATAAGLVLWLALVPGAVFGFGRNAELLTDWYKLMVRPALVENRVTSEHPNQSVPGAVYRLLTHSPSFLVYPDNIPTPAAFHNLADIGTTNARLLVQGCLLGFGLLVVALCRAPRGERSGPRFAAECSLIILGMLLFSERTWKHHAVTLVLPFAVLSAALFAPDTRPAARWWLGGVLAAVALLTTVPGMFPEDTADLAMVYGTHTAAFLLLTAAVVGRLASLRSKPAPEAG
ncbi:MAG TPA: glycosyltransferase family 87 protein [Urbifossiella sp.]|nr:glycosyltransferase family 87 protein [Urbifossiella sp.]